MAQKCENNNEDLLVLAKLGDIPAKNQLVENNTGLVWSIVKRFLNRGYEEEDLFQVGCIGLLKSIKKFDFSFGVKFSTYAVPLILGEIKRFLRDDGMLKVSRTLKENLIKVNITRDILTNELGISPSISEIASRLNLSVEDIIMAIESGYETLSLFSPAYGMDESDSSLLIDTVDFKVSDEEVKIINRIELRGILNTLNTTEKQIIMLRYFKEKTQTQIAKMLDISQVQVSRLEKKILENIRSRM